MTKQETIEEVANRYSGYHKSYMDKTDIKGSAFLDGYSHALKILYSEEDVQEMLNSIINEIEVRKQNILDNKEKMTQHLLEGGVMAFESSIDVIKEIFNQNKKK